MLRTMLLSFATVVGFAAVATHASASSFDREHNGKSAASAPTTTTSTTATATPTNRFVGVKAMQAAPGTDPVVVNTPGDQTDSPLNSFQRERGLSKSTTTKAGPASAPPPAVEKTVQ